MLGYPNCSIRFKSEKEDNDCIYTTWGIYNRKAYNAIEKFFSEIEKEKIYVCRKDK